MATVALPTTDYYMNILSVLSNMEKLELISKLSASIALPAKRRSKQKQLEMLKGFEGDWGGDTPVEEYAESLRSSVASIREHDTW